jgi:hypothetical protein
VRGPDGWEKRKELGERYGNTEGNLGNLKAGEVDSTISSPPFAGTDVSHNLNTSNQEKFSHVGSVAQGHNQEYGQTEGQLGNMKANDPNAVISSPPFESGLPQQDRNFTAPHDTSKNLQNAVYGTTNGNIGNDTGEDFWSAAKLIVEQTYMALKPGGHAIWVLKDFVKAGKIIPFSDQWRRLCEAVGFETVHWHKSWLVEDKGTQLGLFGEEKHNVVKRYSFFKRLHAEKYPHLEIQHENVLCMVKPE